MCDLKLYVVASELFKSIDSVCNLKLQVAGKCIVEIEYSFPLVRYMFKPNFVAKSYLLYLNVYK